MHHKQARRAAGATGGRRVHRADPPREPEALQPLRTHLVRHRQLCRQRPGDPPRATPKRLEENAFCTPLRGPHYPPQGAKSRMKRVFWPLQGAINSNSARFLAPSGVPFIYIYQAGAQRTRGAVVLPPLPHRFWLSRSIWRNCTGRTPARHAPGAPHAPTPTGGNCPITSAGKTHCRPPARPDCLHWKWQQWAWPGNPPGIGALPRALLVLVPAEAITHPPTSRARKIINTSCRSPTPTHGLTA